MKMGMHDKMSMNNGQMDDKMKKDDQKPMNMNDNHMQIMEMDKKMDAMAGMKKDTMSMKSTQPSHKMDGHMGHDMYMMQKDYYFV